MLEKPDKSYITKFSRATYLKPENKTLLKDFDKNVRNKNYKKAAQILNKLMDVTKHAATLRGSSYEPYDVIWKINVGTLADLLTDVDWDNPKMAKVLLELAKINPKAKKETDRGYLKCAMALKAIANRKTDTKKKAILKEMGKLDPGGKIMENVEKGIEAVKARVYKRPKSKQPEIQWEE